MNGIFLGIAQFFSLFVFTVGITAAILLYFSSYWVLGTLVVLSAASHFVFGAVIASSANTHLAFWVGALVVHLFSRRFLRRTSLFPVDRLTTHLCVHICGFGADKTWSPDLQSPIEVFAAGHNPLRHDLLGLVDTGAQQSIISAEWVHAHPDLRGLVQRLPQPLSLRAFNEQATAIDSYIDLQVVSKLLTVSHRFLVVPNINPIVFIGWDLCQKFKWTVIDVPVHTPAQYRDLEKHVESQDVAQQLLDPSTQPGFRWSDQEIDEWATRIEGRTTADSSDLPITDPYVRRVVDYEIRTNSLDSSVYDEAPVLDAVEETYDMEQGPSSFTHGSIRNEKPASPELYSQFKMAVKSCLAVNQAVGKTPGQFTSHPLGVVELPILKDVAPVFTPQYGLKQELQPLVDLQVKKWLTAAIIVEIVYSDWSSPLLAVSKKDAITGLPTGTRVCLDFRRVNACLDVPNMQNIPSIPDLFKKAAGKRFYTALDLRHSYHQLPVKPEHQSRTAFKWHGKSYMFRGAPFGLKHLTSHMQRLMEVVLVDSYDYTMCFVDDVVICSNSLEEHIRHVTAVVDSLTKWNLSLNIEKCQWCFTELSALGHRIGAYGRSADPDKIKKAVRWTRPSTGKQMMAFLGFTNYLRDYLVHYASLVAPLDCLRMCKVITPDDWTPDRIAAFDAIRHAFATVPQLLQAPLPGYKLLVATDASQFGIGAVLYQMVEGKPRYIEFASRSLNTAQRNYSATRRELLAVVFALQRFQFYLTSPSFTLQTDHRALVFMLTQQHVNPMLCTWMETILSFNFDVEHISGVLNVLPDALSRQYPSHLRHRSPLCLELGSHDPVPPTVHARYFCANPKSPVFLGGGETLDPTCKIRSIRLLDRYPTLPPAESVRVAMCYQVNPIPIRRVDFNAFARSFSLHIRPAFAQPAPSPAEDVGPQAATGSLSVIPVDEGVPDETHIKEIIREYSRCQEPESVEKKAQLIEAAHLQGHVGGRKTALAVVRSGFFWRGLIAECHAMVASCLECQRYNVGKHGFNPIKVVTSEYPWQQISYDLKDFSAMKSSDGYNYALVVVDRFSKYILLCPLKTKSSEEVMRELWILFTHFGFTSIVQHDNGTEFSNVSADTFYRLFNTDVRVSTPYHKRGNGIVENMIKNMELILYKVLQGRLSEWHKFLPNVQLTMNCIEDGPTGSSPYTLVFGRKPVVNLGGASLTRSQLTTDTLTETDAVKVHQWQKHLQAISEVVYPTIRDRVIDARQKGSDRDHKGHIDRPTGYFPVDSFVMVVNQEKATKHDVKYVGPMQVKVYDIKTGCYQVVDAEGKIFPRKLQASQMKSVVPKVTTFSSSGEFSVYEVEAIVAHKLLKDSEKNDYLYLVKWKGHELDQYDADNWLAYDRFVDKEMIQQYWKVIANAKDVAEIPKYAQKAFQQLKDSSSSKKVPHVTFAAEADQASVKRRTPGTRPSVIPVSPEEYKELYAKDKDGVSKWIDEQSPEQLMRHSGLRSKKK